MSNRMPRGRAFAVGGGGVLVVLVSQTRTALLALVAGLALALLSLFLTRKRVRRAAAVALGVAPFAVAVLGGRFITWFNRDQSAELLNNLTGRKSVWENLVVAPRSEFVQWFGHGLSDKGFDGLPIDSTWLGLYHEEGLVGVALVGGLMLVLLWKVLTSAPGPARAVALFLLGYCAVASYTEVGPGDPTAYTLSLMVAASLLMPEANPPSRADALERPPDGADLET
jgi:O-antigen ligase